MVSECLLSNGARLGISCEATQLTSLLGVTAVLIGVIALLVLVFYYIGDYITLKKKFKQLLRKTSKDSSYHFVK